MDDKIFIQQMEDERGFDPMGFRLNRCPKPDPELEEMVSKWIDGGIPILGEANYCPNCGADMRGGK